MMNGSNRVSLGQTRVVEDDVIHDVMRRRAGVSAWRVERVKARERSALAREGV